MYRARGEQRNTAISATIFSLSDVTNRYFFSRIIFLFLQVREYPFVDLFGMNDSWRDTIAGSKNPRGCLISCAIPTCAPENRAVADIVASKRMSSVLTLRGRFQQAVKNGELPRDTDTDQLARFYGAIIQGMSIQALDGAGAKALRGIAETALKAWPGGTRPRLVPQ